MKLFIGADAINKAIVSIAGRGARLDSDIHVAACSALQHATDHGDASLCDKLVHAMPKGGRKLALVEFMLAYGQVAKLDAKADKEAIAGGRVFAYDKARALDMQSAQAKSWTEFKKEQAVSTAFDAQAALANVLARFKGANSKGMSIENKAEALATAKAIVAQLEG